MSDTQMWSTDGSPQDAVAGHLLPDLAYAYTALEPVIDSRTLQLHREQHHGGYVTKLNDAISDHQELANRSAIWLLMNPNKVPQSIRTAVVQNAGGHFNHSLFWRAMTPEPGNEPSGALADQLIRDFGSIRDFKSRFVEAGRSYFGSGWVWLVRTQLNGGELKIICTADHENPLQQGLLPILLNDLWEHAYYLKYENRRAEYLEHWWNIANWEEASRLFTSSDLLALDRWISEGGRLASTSSRTG